MIFFQCDYEEGCHPKLLEALTRTNYEQTAGYGTDAYCASAREKIRRACEREDADVHFLVGGTQANTVVISAALSPWQGVLAAQTGHVAVHETGAIEATGHKVITLPGNDGKISAAQVEAAVRGHYEDESHEHIVQPGMVYISYPTESGTLYGRKELGDLYEVCRKYDIPLFIDGARLAYGLASEASQLTLPEIARLCDVFYIGGTKCGALFGEAVVILREDLKKDFRYMIKQKGGMLAKGRLLGIQFDALFTDGLYEELGRGAVEKAMRIRKAFADRGIRMFGTSMTNQQFPILTKAQMEYLGRDFAFEIWEKREDGTAVVRFCTSWATTGEQLNALIEAIGRMPE